MAYLRNQLPNLECKIQAVHSIILLQHLLVSIVIYPTASATLPSISKGFSINADVSGNPEFCVLVYPQAPITPIFSSTCRRTNLLPPSAPIAESKIPFQHRRAASMELQIAIWEPDFQNFLSTCLQSGRITLAPTYRGTSWVLTSAKSTLFIRTCNRVSCTQCKFIEHPETCP